MDEENQKQPAYTRFDDYDYDEQDQKRPYTHFDDYDDDDEKDAEKYNDHNNNNPPTSPPPPPPPYQPPTTTTTTTTATATIITHWRLVRDPALLPPAVAAHRWAQGSGTPSDPYLVDFLPNSPPPTTTTTTTTTNDTANAIVVVDPRNPLALPPRTRWAIAALNALATLALTFASSAYASAVPDLVSRRLRGIGPETALLGTSLFVLGFALGPLVWAPLSESYGRRPVFLCTYGPFVLLNLVAALAPDLVDALVVVPEKNKNKNNTIAIALLVAARALGGMLGASALVNSSSGTADLFSPRDRGKVNAWFSAAPFLGPVLGPIAGGFLSQGAGGWRGVGALITAMTAAVWLVYFLVVPETYAPVLLRLRAARLTSLGRGGSGVYYQSRLDKAATGGGGGPAKTTTAQVLRVALVRPFRLLASETIVLVLSVYMAIIFGAMYLMFAAFPIVFQAPLPAGYGLSQGDGGLAFLGIGAGMVLALVYMLFANKEYVRIAQAAPGGRAPPEARLLPARLGAVMVPAGLIVFAVTNAPGYHVLVPILGTVPFGFGMVVIFVSLLAYLVDTYTVYAASAVAAATAVRSLFGAVFPLFTRAMFARLGVHWGAGVPALLAALCLPFPFLFVVYGARIREKAKFATEARNMAMKMAAAGPEASKPKGDEKIPLPVAEYNGRPLSESHGPTAEGEWQCYGRYCLGCGVDEDNYFVCRNASLYEKKDWAMQ